MEAKKQIIRILVSNTQIKNYFQTIPRDIIELIFDYPYNELYIFPKNKLHNCVDEIINVDSVHPIEFFKQMKITKFSCSDNHVAVIANGDLYTFGKGSNGILGHGNNNDIEIPKKVEFFMGLGEITDICCSQYHTAVVCNGKLYTFGLNMDGRLGIDAHNMNLIINIPTLVDGLENVTKISCGSGHFAIIADKKLYMYGQGTYGQLGCKHIYKHIKFKPVWIEALKNVTDVSCNKMHTAVLADGILYTFGSAYYGQLGHTQAEGYPIGQIRILKIPVKVDFFDTFKDPINAISCGADHSAVLIDKKVYIFGRGSEGQLGQNTCISDRSGDLKIPTIIPSLNNIDKISCGWHNTTIVDNNSLFICGSIWNSCRYNKPTPIKDFFNGKIVELDCRYDTLGLLVQ